MTIRLTTDRLLAIAHYGFQPDRVWEIPRASIDEVSVGNGTLVVTYRDEHGGVSALSVGQWAGGYVDSSLRGQAICSLDDVADALDDWMAR